MKSFGCQSMVGRLEKVLVKSPGNEFVVNDWKAYGYLGRVNLRKAKKEHEAFTDLLRAEGCEVSFLDGSENLMDAIYTHDPAIVTDEGSLLMRMGKPLRRGEVGQMEKKFLAMGIPTLARIKKRGTAEGGDCLWLDRATLSVGRGYRTNGEGLGQIRSALRGVSVVEVPLPHYVGEGSVLHLMSLISLLDSDLAVIYPRLMPVPFIELLKKRKMTLLPIPEEEFDTMGCNVLALRPRRCLMLDLNRKTRKLLEREGCDVLTYEGAEISVKGSGGPTCLTRPLLRR